ncbi:MAG: PCMD domain-containing protein [Bacteroidaceae bacterium]|nr:PCMD domain-containing protein [Bacteroidaceae bacterium]
MRRRLLILFVNFSVVLACFAQREELIKFADFEQWMKRDIKESGVIGGETKTLYEIAPSAHWNKDNKKQNTPYCNQGGSPWATSNIYARVSGINKTNISVWRDVHDNGYCVKLQTHIENVKVLGLINISVLASGAIFTGEMIEPITDTDNPMSKMDLGVPFNKKPKAIKFDYKVHLTGEPNRIRQSGFSKVTTVPGKDMPEMVVYLQHRTEDADGNIVAKRVGTLIYNFPKSTNGWRIGQTFEIHYGDITSASFYESRMGLLNGAKSLYARNSKGKVVPINENAWADKSLNPTHAIVKFDSSCGGAYIGTIGTTLWLDNIKWVYD